MDMRSDIFNDYLNSILAQGLSKGKRAEIRREFESHLDEKTDWFIEIGFDEETASQKAVTEMGAPDEVREQLYEIHKEKTYKTVLLIVGLFVFMIYAMLYGFMYANLDTADPPKVYQVLLSAIYMSFITLLLLRNREHRKVKTSIALSVYFLIAAVLSWPFSAPTQPVFYALAEIFSAICVRTFTQGKETDIYRYMIDNGIVAVFGSILFNAGCAVSSFITALRSNKSKVIKKAGRRKGGHALPVLIAALVLFSFVMPSGYYMAAKSLNNKFELTETQRSKYYYEITVETLELLDSIKFEMSESEVNDIIKKGSSHIIYSSKSEYKDEESGEYQLSYELKHRMSRTYHNLDGIFITIVFNKQANMIHKDLSLLSADYYDIKKIKRIDTLLSQGMKREEVLNIFIDKKVYPDNVYQSLSGFKTDELITFNIIIRSDDPFILPSLPSYWLEFEDGILVKHQIEVD